MPELSYHRFHQQPHGRRVAPRMDADGYVVARLMTLNVPVQMRDVSLTGFRLTSPAPVAVGDVHKVRAVAPTGLVCTLVARVVRCEPSPGAGPSYTSGWEVSPDPASTSALAAVVDSLPSNHNEDADAVEN